MTLEPRDYLQPDEAVLLQTRPDPRSVVPGLVGRLVFVGVAIVALVVLRARFLAETPSWWVAVGASALGLLWLAHSVVVVLRIRTSRYVMTDTRLYRSFGRIRFQLLQTTYDKVTDLHVAQGPVGRAWGYGKITVNTAGAALDLPGIPAPFEVKRQLEEARTAFLRKLVAAHKKVSAKSTTGLEQGLVLASAPGVALWSGSPAGKSLLGRFVAAALMVVAGLVLGVLGPLGFTSGYAMAGLLLLAGLVSALSAYVVYRYSRFEVNRTGVVVSTGWLSRRRIETTFSKVTDVTTTQTLLGRLLGYGDIRINTAGSNDIAVAFAGVARPDEVKGIIDRARGARP